MASDTVSEEQSGQRTTRIVRNGERLSTATMYAVGEFQDCSPVHLPVFNRTVDPDALNAISAEENGDGSITFEYAGTHVEIEFGREIVVSVTAQ